MQRKVLIILSVALLFLTSCNLNFKTQDEDVASNIEILRYDRLECRYLTTGDFSALQQMNTVYPIETRTLIEDMLGIGEVSDPEINSKFLNFYQDTLLQEVLAEVQLQYANIDDLNKLLSKSFARLQKLLPNLKIPRFYAQVGALNQSIVVGDMMIGISLDKYLGKDFPVYKKYYDEKQIQSMTREYIVPDCLAFYLLSQYHMEGLDQRTQFEKDMHMGEVMWVVNKAVDQHFFKTEFVKKVDNYMKQHHNVSLDNFLYSTDFSWAE